MKNLRKYCVQYGLKVQHLALAAGVDEIVVYEWLRGQPAELEMHLKIARLLDCPLVELGVPADITDYTGKKFGKLKVLEFAGIDTHRQPLWRCRCECKAETICHSLYLTVENVPNCGAPGCAPKEELIWSAYCDIVKQLLVNEAYTGTGKFFGIRTLKNGEYGAVIEYKGKTHTLGSFPTKEQAIEARRTADALVLRPYIERHRGK